MLVRNTLQIASLGKICVPRMSVGRLNIWGQHVLIFLKRHIVFCSTLCGKMDSYGPSPIFFFSLMFIFWSVDGVQESSFGHFMKVLLGCQKPFFKIALIWGDVEDTIFSVCLMKAMGPLWPTLGKALFLGC